MSNACEPKHLVLELTLLTPPFLNWLERIRSIFPGTQVQTYLHPMGTSRIRITLPNETAFHYARAAASLARWKVFAESR